VKVKTAYIVNSGRHLDTAAKFQCLVILSEAKNLCTESRPVGNSSARPFASPAAPLRVTPEHGTRIQMRPSMPGYEESVCLFAAVFVLILLLGDSMRNVKSAAIAAVIAESGLCLVPALFGHYFMWPGSGGIVVLIPFFFHLPGIFLVQWMFSDPDRASLASYPALAFVVITGLLQSFLISWVVIRILQRSRTRGHTS